MRILFVSSFLLFRQTRFGGTKRLYNLAQELQKKCELWVLCFDGCYEQAGFNQSPAEFGRFLQVPLHDPTSVFGRLRLPYDMGQTLQVSRQAIAAFIGATRFDSMFLAFPRALQFLKTPFRLQADRIVYAEDDLVVEQYRSQCRNRTKTLLKRLGGVYRWLQVRHLYRRLMPYVNRVVAISPQEEQVLRRFFPRSSSSVVTYGVDPQEYPLLDPPHDRAAIGFIGNYKHPPNYDALEYLLGTLCPAARNAGLSFSVVIAGAGLAPAMQQRYAADTTIQWMGTVADVRAFYESISLFVNPIVSFRGLRTKLIEAAAFGRPILTTPLGAEGLEDLDAVLFANTEEFVRQLKRCLSDETFTRGHSAHARAVFLQRYSQEQVGAALLNALEG